MDTPRFKIALYLVLVFGLSSIFYTLIISAGTLGVHGGAYVFALMWCPGVAAILTRLITQRNLRGHGWVPRRGRDLAIAYVLPILYATPVYLLVWALGLGVFRPEVWTHGAGLVEGSTPLTGLLSSATIGVALSLLFATGEEIGWRGLLVPELAKVARFRTVALVSGAIWASWHLPLILFADYNAGSTTPLIYSTLCFIAMVLVFSTVMAWLRLRSGSFWPAALLHASHNLFVQVVFDASTKDVRGSAWLTGEFGIGLVVTIGLVAWIVTTRWPVADALEPTARAASD